MAICLIGFLRVAGADPGAGLLVEPDWLRDRLGDPRLLILDARPPAEYRLGHLPGAVSLPVAKTFGPPPRDDLLGPVTTVASVLGATGVSHQKQIVVYGDGKVKDAARLFWVLEVFGHTDVHFLDGGAPLWLQSGYAMTTDAPVIQPSRFVPRLRPARLSTQLNTRLAIDDAAITLIDARTTPEFSGRESKTDRFGHITSAFNVPSAENLTQDNGTSRFKPVSELRALYAPLVKTSKVVTYCNRGKDAAIDYLALRLLGKNVSTYDGSWFEWSKNPALPVTNPSARTLSLNKPDNVSAHVHERR